MTAYELRMHLMSAVEFIVIAQLYIVGLIALFTVVLLSFRRNYSRALEKHQAHYLETLVLEITEIDPLVKKVSVLKRPKWFEPIKRNALRSLLLSQIDAVSGPEKKYLIDTYKHLGFAQDDLMKCFSFFWWKRLEGISKLSHLEIPGVSITLNRLKNDSHDLVAESALVSLCALKHEFNNADTLKKIRASTLTKHNLLLKIASNWIKVHGIDFVIHYMKTEKRKPLLYAFVASLSELKDLNAVNALMKWFKEHGDIYDAPTMVYFIRSMRSLGDPAHLPIAADLLRHENEIVRAEALMMLVANHTDEYDQEIELMSSDPSLTIQRTLQSYRKNKARAA